MIIIVRQFKNKSTLFQSFKGFVKNETRMIAAQESLRQVVFESLMNNIMAETIHYLSTSNHLITSFSLD